MPDKFDYDVFLSHSLKDKTVARDVAERLRKDGLRVWFDEWEVRPGDSIPAKIEEGLENSRVLLFCMSANAFGSDWAQLESGVFRFRDPLNKDRRFLPLRLDDAPIKGSLTQFSYIKWLPPDRELEYGTLLNSCRPPAISTEGKSLPSTTEASNSQNPGEPGRAPNALLANGEMFNDNINTWCPEMVVIPQGQFLMGSREEDPDAYSEEKPEHMVIFKTRFALGRYLVTFDEFDFFCDRTDRRKPSDEGWGRGRHPVINVCWNDANAFTDWLAIQTGVAYRLPSEAEWEYACRAGTNTRFYRGYHLSPKHANYDDQRGKTTPVGSYPANPWGLYDMHGNVWEHVQDTFHPNYDAAPGDGSAWLEGGDINRRVVRGGSFSYSAKDNRSAVRCDHDVAIPDIQHGFRVARSL